MGSFFETCALSNLPIPDGTPVRQLFLTQNPYRLSDDGWESGRGVYHNDYWFARTPPIEGNYDDYGRAKLNNPEICRLVAAVLSDDIVERPFGFNKFHEPPVRRDQDLSHYLEAAWEGRLLVVPDRDKVEKEEEGSWGWVTWKKIARVLEEAGLPLQVDRDTKGYNVQPVMNGVVAVHFNDYGDTTQALGQAAKHLDERFECRLVYKHEDTKYDPCLIVTARNCFTSPSYLADVEGIRRELNTHPDLKFRSRPLVTLAVMVREDVWQAFLEIGKKLANSFEKDFVKYYDRLEKRKTDSDFFINMRDVGFEIVGQTSVQTHIQKAVELEGFLAREELLKACIELSQVELVMMRLHRPWSVPILGGQDTHWQLHKKLLSSLGKICINKGREESE